MIHGEPYIRPPALREILAVLCARRRRFEMSDYQMARAGKIDEGIAGWWRRTFLTAEGTAKDRRLRELLLEHYGLGGDQIQIIGNAGNLWRSLPGNPPGVVDSIPFGLLLTALVYRLRPRLRRHEHPETSRMMPVFRALCDNGLVCSEFGPGHPGWVRWWEWGSLLCWCSTGWCWMSQIWI